MKLITGKNKPQNIFTSFLDSLGVNYTNTFSNKYFNEHPHKYNLFGLTKMLSEFNVENAAWRIKNKEEGLSDLEAPFIAHTGSDFVIVKKIMPQQIRYVWNEKEITVSLEEFYKSWTGVVLIAEPGRASQEPEYEKHKIQERIHRLKKAGLFICSVLLLSILYMSHPERADMGFNLLLLINIIGIYISYLLAQKQMKVQSVYADKICSLFKQSDCNNILESDAAKLLGVFSWSEIGLGYFSANTTLLLFFPHLISYLSLINICALPYTVWSVWYQKFKAGQWCPLCLIVQGVLWALFIINLIFGYLSIPSFHLSDLLITTCLYFIPILVVNLLISGLSQSGNTEQIKQEINSLKTIDEVFVALLKKQVRYEVNRDTSRILFGNTEADTLLTLFTNPHCNPCALMHKRIENLLAENKNICVQYIFSSFEESLDSSNRFLIAAYLNKSEEWRKIADEWFETGKNDKEKFFHSYGLKNTDEVLTEFNRHENWKQKTGLRATPTILVNGYKLPDNYKIEDLRYFTNLVIDAK
jgi:Protein-disulfide isomerase